MLCFAICFDLLASFVFLSSVITILTGFCQTIDCTLQSPRSEHRQVLRKVKAKTTSTTKPVEPISYSNKQAKQCPHSSLSVDSDNFVLFRPNTKQSRRKKNQSQPPLHRGQKHSAGFKRFTRTSSFRFPNKTCRCFCIPNRRPSFCKFSEQTRQAVSKSAAPPRKVALSAHRLLFHWVKFPNRNWVRECEN